MHILRSVNITFSIICCLAFLTISCNRENEERVSMEDIKEIEKFLKIHRKSVEIMPRFLNEKDCKNDLGIHNATILRNNNYSEYSFNGIKLKITSRIEEIGYYDKIISFQFWNDCLMNTFKSNMDLKTMSPREIYDYGEKIGFKSKVMEGAKECLVIYGNVNNIICTINSNGSLEGRLWSHDGMATKKISGKSSTENSKLYCFLWMLSGIENFGE